LKPKQSLKEQTQLECVNNRKISLRLKENLLKAGTLKMSYEEDLNLSNKLSFIVYIVVSLILLHVVKAILVQKSSSKLHILQEKMINEGHKILIFSQSPGMLKLIQVFPSLYIMQYLWPDFSRLHVY
jgi:SNF2 family DNA or RNA helicase